MSRRLFIAIVDDDISVRQALGSLLRSFDIDTLDFGSAQELLASPALLDFSGFLTDVVMPGMNGFALARQLRDKGCKQPIIFMTAYQHDGDAQEARDLDAACLLTKPFTTEEIMECIRLHFHRRADGDGEPC